MSVAIWDEVLEGAFCSDLDTSCGWIAHLEWNGKFINDAAPMTIKVRLDTSNLPFYRDAPDNYCHFVLGNLFEVFVGLSESSLIGSHIELEHNNIHPAFQQLYSVFTARQPHTDSDCSAQTRVVTLTPSANWSTLRATRDLSAYLQRFQLFVWHQLGIEATTPKQVTLIRRSLLASNRYIINEASLVRRLKRECATRGLAFQVVDFEGMSFEQQVQLMARTSVLIGIHGAGLVNAMFLPPTASVIELLPHRRFEAHFFRWMGMSKGLRWIRVLEPSWSVPSLYNIFLACTRPGHTRKNRFFRDRNAAFDPRAVMRALALATHQVPTAANVEDVTLEAEEGSSLRKWALVLTHRKFLLILVFCACAGIWLHPFTSFWLVATTALVVAFCW